MVMIGYVVCDFILYYVGFMFDFRVEERGLLGFYQQGLFLLRDIYYNYGNFEYLKIGLCDFLWSFLGEVERRGRFVL